MSHMTVDIFIEIRGRIDSHELYDVIGRHGVIVTDLGEQTLVYGNISTAIIAPIITTCATFGDCHAHITRPTN